MFMRAFDRYNKWNMQIFDTVACGNAVDTASGSQMN